METIIRKWTKAEKRLMADGSSEVYELLNKKFSGDKFKMAFTLKLLYNSFADEIAMEKIILVNQSGKKMFPHADRLKNVRQTVEGMQQSNVNLILFHQEPEVWMMYFMGIYLKRPTFIIAREKDRKYLEHLVEKGGLVRHIEYVKKFNEKTLEAFTKKIADMMKKEFIE